MRQFLVLLFIMLSWFSKVFSQNQLPDSALISPNITVQGVDTLKSGFVRDTIAPVLLRALDSVQIAQYKDSVSRTLGYPGFSLEEGFKNFSRFQPQAEFSTGNIRNTGELWVISIIGVLLVFFAVLVNFFDRQLMVIVQSFFSNRILSNINKEDSVFNSWPFILAFIHFGFTLGLFVYLAAESKGLPVVRDGIKAFLSFSVAIITLYFLKIVALRFLGFFFNIQKPVGEYISILYLTYFNASILFMPLVLAFALSPIQYADLYITCAIFIVLIIFFLQLARAGFNLLSQNRFSKVYLFLYFCTLEICPILILIKAIGF